MPQPISNPIFPLNKVIRGFMEQTNMQIKANLITQKVWPTEIYPGYKIKNEANKRDGLPHSTGDGSRSFQSRLVRADQAGNVTLVFNYNDYMRYVDIGVGGKRKAENVERSKECTISQQIYRYMGPNRRTNTPSSNHDGVPPPTGANQGLSRRLLWIWRTSVNTLTPHRRNH